MKYQAGIWMYIQTTSSHSIKFIPLNEIFKYELKSLLVESIEGFNRKIERIKVVLIGLTSEFFLAKLPPELTKKTSIIERQNECDIYFDKDTRQIKVSVEHKNKIKTLIVDDSSTIRMLIRKLLESDSRFEITGEAGHPTKAFEMIMANNYDLITMDLHLPEISGADLIKKYFKIKQIPTVVISSLRPEESDLVLQSLENGAVDYIQKPEQKNIHSAKDEVIQKLLGAAMAKTKKSNSNHYQLKKIDFSQEKRLLAIGASTGGTEAIRILLQQMGEHIPPTVIVQHIPPVFSKAFAERLNRLLPFEVKEAVDGDLVKQDQVLIAPGGKQMKMIKVGRSEYKVKLTDDPQVNRHRPSVDYLFDSIVECYKGELVAVILTGMGADGANGLVKLKNFGAHTIAQDESSSVVFGMPREAILRGGATEIIELYQMGTAIAKGYSSKD